jgi:ribose 5-phosphate isomerase B
MTKIFLASDHAGVDLKSKVLEKLRTDEISSHYEIHDMGPQSTESVDYPDYADLVCKKLHGFTMLDSQDKIKTHPTEVGILICGSGEGMCMRANKYAQIRAALCWNVETARLSREHNDANVLCLAARLIDHDLCLEMVQTFLKTAFAGGRHRQRVVKVSTPV